MNRKLAAFLPLLALLLGLRAMAQDAPPPQQLQQPPQIQQGGNSQDTLMSVAELNRHTAFLNADPNRLNEILKRAAAVVRTRYMLIARPALPLGRLLRIPFCGGQTGRGVIVPGPVAGHGVLSMDRSTYPNFSNCAFVFETFERDEGQRLDEKYQTALYADIRVKLSFQTGSQQLPSSARAPTQNIVRWDAELTGEPYVFQAIPNIPPPVSISTPTAQAFDWPNNAEPDALPDSRDFGVPAQDVSRLEIARRAILAQEGGIVRESSIMEARQFANSNIDPCGETPRFKAPFINTLNVLEERCYTYGARMITFGNQNRDPRYQGQLRILFQKDPRNNKIIGVRAFAFGGNI